MLDITLKEKEDTDFSFEIACNSNQNQRPEIGTAKRTIRQNLSVFVCSLQTLIWKEKGGTDLRRCLKQDLNKNNEYILEKDVAGYGIKIQNKLADSIELKAHTHTHMHVKLMKSD